MELTSFEKGKIALEHPQLNAILTQIRTRRMEIGTLMKRVNVLNDEINELDDEFHREALKVKPTEVVKVKKSASSKIDVAIIKEIQQRIQQNPDLLEQLRKVKGLENFDL